MKITRWIVLAFFYLVLSVHAAEELIALKAARLFDGKLNTLVQNAVFIVEVRELLMQEPICQFPAPHASSTWAMRRFARDLWMPTRI
jgi:hypothetical protein